MENIKVKLWVAIFTVGVPLLISMVSAYFSNLLAVAQMNVRIATIQEKYAKHEMERGQDIQRLLNSRDDHAQRIIRLEASLDGIHMTLSEMKEDIKTLIKARH